MRKSWLAPEEQCSRFISGLHTQVCLHTHTHPSKSKRTFRYTWENPHIFVLSNLSSFIRSGFIWGRAVWYFRVDIKVSYPNVTPVKGSAQKRMATPQGNFKLSGIRSRGWVCGWVCTLVISLGGNGKCQANGLCMCCKSVSLPCLSAVVSVLGISC